MSKERIDKRFDVIGNECCRRKEGLYVIASCLYRGLKYYVSLRLCYGRTVVSLRMTFINSGVKFSTVTALKIPLENTSQDSPVAEIPSYVPHAGS